MVMIKTIAFTVYSAFFARDPDGNRFVLHQLKGDRG